MPRLKFKDESWDELVPIFVENNDNLEKIATGVLLNIFDNIFLLTASHVIDQAKNIGEEIQIPTKNGFEYVAGTLYHRYLQKNENREDDMLDFSYYKLSKEMIDVLETSFNPLTEEMIELSDDFSTELEIPDKLPHIKELKKHLKSIYDNQTIENNEKLKLIEDFREKTNITFAGYPNTKTKEKDDGFYSELCYYHGHGVNKSIYKQYNYIPEDNIIASFAKMGTMNSDFDHSIHPKPDGISGGGIYRLIHTEEGIDRKLIGIGHTYKTKKHLFIGTNLFFCLSIIIKRIERENISNSELKQ